MRLRTGHKPSDWSENQPASARLSWHGGSSIHGELVRGGESMREKQARYAKDYKARKRSEQQA